MIHHLPACNILAKNSCLIQFLRQILIKKKLQKNVKIHLSWMYYRYPSLSGQSWISEDSFHCLLTWSTNYRKISGDQDSQKGQVPKIPSYWEEKPASPSIKPQQRTWQIPTCRRKAHIWVWGGQGRLWSSGTLGLSTLGKKTGKGGSCRQAQRFSDGNQHGVYFSVMWHKRYCSVCFGCWCWILKL